MSFAFRICTLFLLLLLVSCSGDRQKDTAAQHILTQIQKRSHAPAVVAAVGRDGIEIWSGAEGFADLEQQVPADAHTTLFRIGSVSKTMTAAAIGRLWQQGKLKLDAPIQTYLPDFPLKKYPITTRLVAGHLAGIRHYKDGEFYNAKHFDSVSSGLSFFKEDPLLFKPGEKYSYSSYGYNLLSVVVEEAAQMDFLTYMQDTVFALCGMQKTIADQVQPIIAGRSRYYNLKRDSSVINAPWVDNSYKWAGGGFLSTASDLLKLGFAHLDQRILQAATIDTLWKAQHTSDGKSTHYGIGWSSGEDASGRRWVGHGGGSVGGTTFFRVYPDQGLVVGVIANLSGAQFYDLPEKLADLFLQTQLNKSAGE